MRALSALALALAFVASGCSGSAPTSRPSPPRLPDPGDTQPAPIAPVGDVMLEGVSLVGAWYAVEVQSDRQATRDLEDGTLEQTLIVEPNGRAILTGIDRREGGEPVTFVGQIATNRITFRGMDGAGTLIVSGRRLILRDPGNRRTVYVRGRN